MTSLEAPSNLLQIGSNHKSSFIRLQFILKLEAEAAIAESLAGKVHSSPVSI